MTHLVSLSGLQTVREAEETAQLLRDALTHDGPILLDCDSVEEADLAFLQLVIAARKSAERAGKKFGLTAPAKGGLLAALDSAGIAPTEIHRFWFEGTASS